MYFEYGITEIEHLKKRDKLLGDAIDKIGHIKRPVNTDIFTSVVHHIIGQQISTKAHATVWQRFVDKIGNVNENTIHSIDINELQKIGTTFRKAGYIKDFAEKVRDNEFDVSKLEELSDSEVIKKLFSLKGIGVWTAEMIMIFSMRRPDIVSFGDLAILRGMRMLYHQESIDRKKFEKYAKNYSPFGTVASLYIWAIAGGAVPEMRDYALKNNIAL